MQQKLREELLAVPTDTPTMEELNALPYLDLIVRETLRLHAPVTITSRMAVEDDVLPLATPLTDKHGNMVTEIPIRKGQRIIDRKSTRLNSSHSGESRMPSSA